MIPSILMALGVALIAIGVAGLLLRIVHGPRKRDGGPAGPGPCAARSARPGADGPFRPVFFLSCIRRLQPPACAVSAPIRGIPASFPDFLIPPPPVQYRNRMAVITFHQQGRTRT